MMSLCSSVRLSIQTLVFFLLEAGKDGLSAHKLSQVKGLSSHVKTIILPERYLN